MPSVNSGSPDPDSPQPGPLPSPRSEDTVNVSVSPALEGLIRRKVESGLYESIGQVIQEALLLLEERDQVTLMRRERLLAEIAKGVYQADNRQLIDFDEVLRGLQRKLTTTAE
jgi:antitoxin ParD1/3/4